MRLAENYLGVYSLRKLFSSLIYKSQTSINIYKTTCFRLYHIYLVLRGKKQKSEEVLLYLFFKQFLNFFEYI